MNPVIYAVVDPTATDPNLRMMPVSGTDNGDGTCSIDTTGGGGGGGGDASAANQATQITAANVTNSRLILQLTELEDINTHTTSLDVTLGTQGAAAASTDAGTFSLIALFKRLLGKFGTLVNGSAPVRTSAKQVTWTNRSGTITAGNSAQTLAAANAVREGFEIINLSTGDLWFNDQGAATLAQPSYRLSAGQSYTMPLNGVSTAALSIIGATTAQAFSAREW